MNFVPSYIIDICYINVSVFCWYLSFQLLTCITESYDCFSSINWSCPCFCSDITNRGKNKCLRIIRIAFLFIHFLLIFIFDYFFCVSISKHFCFGQYIVEAALSFEKHTCTHSGTAAQMENWNSLYMQLERRSHRQLVYNPFAIVSSVIAHVFLSFLVYISALLRSCDDL